MPNATREMWKSFLARPDEAAFTPVYERTKALVWTLCWRILANEEDTHDAFQAAYARLLSEVRTGTLEMTPEGGTNPSLYRLAVREAENLRMRSKRRAQKEVAMDPLPNQLSSGASAEELLDRKQLRRQLEGLVRELPDEIRVPLQLHYFDGLTQTEIADALEINQATISRRMSKGIKELEPLARRAGLGDILPALGVVTLGAALMQPPAAFSAAVVFAQASAALAATAAGAAGGMFVANSAATLKHSIWAAAKMNTAALIVSAAFVVGVGTILTLGAIHKANQTNNSSATPGLKSSVQPLGASSSPKSTKPQIFSVSASQKPGPRDVAQATTPNSNPASQTSPVVSTKANGPSRQEGTAQAIPAAPHPNGMLGPWSLAVGNPIFVNSYALIVLGADNVDGDLKLVLVSKEYWSETDIQFLAYDVAGNSHHFIQTTSSTDTLHVYRLVSPPPSGIQITSIAATGDVEKFLAASREPYWGAPDPEQPNKRTETSFSNQKPESLPAANSIEEEPIVQQVFPLADGNPIGCLPGVLCVVGAERTDGKVKLAHYWPAEDKEKIDALQLKFAGFDNRGGTHNFIQTTSSTSQRDGESGACLMYVYELETERTADFKIVSIAMLGNQSEFSKVRTREQVMRVKANMYSMATAIESYYFDNKAYPASTTDVSQSIHAEPAQKTASPGWALPAFQLGKPTGKSGQDVPTSLTMSPLTITTPIAYMTRYPNDPFTKQEGHTYQYATKEFTIDYFTMGMNRSHVTGWILWSPGPDGKYDLDWQKYDPADTSATLKSFLPQTYDPTNGIISPGDLWRIRDDSVRPKQLSDTPIYTGIGQWLRPSTDTTSVPQVTPADGPLKKVYKIRTEDIPAIRTVMDSTFSVQPGVPNSIRAVGVDGDDLIINDTPENVAKVEELLFSRNFIQKGQ